MFIKHKIYLFYSILDLLFLLDKVKGDTDLSSLVSDYDRVDQDICNSIIEEHPCVKNVLKVIIDKIDNIEKTLRKEITIKEQQIHNLEDKLQNIVEIKKRSVSDENLYSYDHSKTSSSIDNSLYSSVKSPNESYWMYNNEESKKIDGWSTVR